MGMMVIIKIMRVPILLSFYEDQMKLLEDRIVGANEIVGIVGRK